MPLNETQPPEKLSLNERIVDVDLAHLGALVVQASMNEALGSSADEHVQNTGLESPNSIGASGFFVAGEVPMSDEMVYRQVGEEAIEDLAKSGVVRNGATAQGTPHPRWGDRVFWHPGNSEKKMQLGGRLVIEADKDVAVNGWVTSKSVRGIYARDSDGTVKNILPNS